MDTIKTTTSAMLPHSAAPLPGYESLRYLLDALAKRAARAAGVPETGVCMPLYREEYDSMTLPERVAMCRAAQQAHDAAHCLIPNPAHFDSLHIGGGRYWVWFYAMRQLASERVGVAKMELLYRDDGVFDSVRTVVLFDDNPLTPVTLPAHRDWLMAVHSFARLYPAVEVIHPTLFDRALDVRLEVAQAQVGKVSA